MKKISLGKGLLLLLICSMGCKKPEGLQYIDLQHFRIRSANLQSSVISADLRYYNPNNFRMKLRHAEMDVSINNKYVGHSNLDTLMNIPKKDTFTLPVQLEIDVSKVLTSSLGALLFDEVDISLTGKARLGKAGIYFNFPFTYQGKQKIRLF